MICSELQSKVHVQFDIASNEEGLCTRPIQSYDGGTALLDRNRIIESKGHSRFQFQKQSCSEVLVIPGTWVSPWQWMEVAQRKRALELKARELGCCCTRCPFQSREG